MVCSTIRTVAATYKSAKSNGHKLDEPASFSGRCIDLERGSRGRDFRIYPGKGIVSISTVEGCKKLSYRCGDYQRGYLESPDGRSSPRSSSTITAVKDGAKSFTLP